jgi:ferritin-like protein
MVATKEKPVDVEQGVNRDLLIYKLLENMIDEFGAGRAYVYTFDNPNHMSNDPIERNKQTSSMVYEETANGIAEIAFKMQDIPRTLFARQLDEILNERILGAPRDSIKDMASSTMMEEIGATHAAVLPYKDKDGKVVLIVGLDWIFADNIMFLESRFRNYVRNIGEIYTGQITELDYTTTSLREPQVTRGEEERRVLPPLPEERIMAVSVESSNLHYMAGNRMLNSNIFMAPEGVKMITHPMASLTND